MVEGGAGGHFEFAGWLGQAASGRVGRPRWDSIGPRGQGQSPPWSRRLSLAHSYSGTEHAGAGRPAARPEGTGRYPECVATARHVEDKAHHDDAAAFADATRMALDQALEADDPIG